MRFEDEQEAWKAFVKHRIREAFRSLDCEDAFDAYWSLVKPHETYTHFHTLLPDMPLLLFKPVRDLLGSIHSFYVGWTAPSNPVFHAEAKRVSQEDAWRMQKRLMRMIRLLLAEEVRSIHAQTTPSCARLREALALIREALADLDARLGEAVQSWEDGDDDTPTPSFAL